MFTRLAAALLAALTVTACGTTPATALDRAGSFQTAASTQLQRFTSDDNGFATHSYYYDTGREVVVFDAQFTAGYAEQLLQHIRRRTASPIKTVVVTHPNPDKFNGAAVFQKLGAKVVASEATAAALPAVHAYKKYYFVNIAKAFTEATYPAQATIDVTFRDRLTLAGGAVELRRLAHAGVASTQTVAFLPRANALVVGDLVHHQAHAWLEGGLVDGQPRLDLDSWKLALNELKAFPGATVHGGRGKSAPVAVAVRDQQRYLDRVEALTRAYIQKLGDRRTELTGPQASTHHAALQAEVAQAFPTYTLPYMTGYSVYGLVNVLLAGRN